MWSRIFRNILASVEKCLDQEIRSCRNREREREKNICPFSPKAEKSDFWVGRCRISVEGEKSRSSLRFHRCVTVLLFSTESFQLWSRFGAEKREKEVSWNSILSIEFISLGVLHIKWWFFNVHNHNCKIGNNCSIEAFNWESPKIRNNTCVSLYSFGQFGPQNSSIYQRIMKKKNYY